MDECFNSDSLVPYWLLALALGIQSLISIFLLGEDTRTFLFGARMDYPDPEIDEFETSDIGPGRNG